MFERTFKVKYITSKNCFCYLSDKYSNLTDQGSVCQINSENGIYFFSLGDYLISLKDNEVGINSIYASLLHLTENDFVTFSQPNTDLPGITSLDISPSSEDDLEMLELMAETIQDTLLNQIRIVNNNQKAVIWLSNFVNITVNIDGVKPVSPGRLGYLTEVAIKAPSRKENKKQSSSYERKWNTDYFTKYFKLPTFTNDRILKQYEKDNVPLVFCVFRLANLKKVLNKTSIFTVYAPGDMLPFNVIKTQASRFFSLHPIHLPSESGFLDETIVNQKNIVVQLQDLEEGDCELEIRYFIPLFMDDTIMKHYRLSVGAKVMLQPDVFIGTTNKIEILTDAYNTEDVKQQFKLFVGENCVEDQVLLNSDVVIDVPNKYKMVFKFADEIPACLITTDFIRNGNILVSKFEFSKTKDVSRSTTKINDFCLDVANFESILCAFMKCLNLSITTRDKLEHVLLVGKCGTGKTSFANFIASKLSSEPYNFHIETVNCKNIKGKSLDSLHKLFTNIFLKLIYYQPSVLILDDIHIICENVVEGDAATQESLAFNKVSEMLVDILIHYIQNNIIMVLTTAESTLKLNRQLFTSRGIHLFKNIFTIDELNKNDRLVFLNFAFSKLNMCEDVDAEQLSMKTEGFVIQDLTDYVEKCAFESYKEDSQTINALHCLNALKASTTLSLKNVKLHSTGDRDFSDIGGLDYVKNILIEFMMWPVQYTNIFAKSPLRLQSGILLYGPPGTGKTILAGASAKQCDLRLISIKGPELLSKYIGASEQAVRDVFQKAQSAKPCILFFDEFDSLAPRRGHDNTGVTDRVVNQFLTQLDGIESLTGVCVLAATSRPDLLDPALLRPGRLDKQILCPLPSKEERLSILKVLSKSLLFDDGVNLDKIAAESDGYSGADLQSLLYTAQLTSMEHLLNETEIGVMVSETRTEIDQRQLEEALKNTRPSLTKEDRLKYERIYAKFQGKVDVSDIKARRQKATLA